MFVYQRAVLLAGEDGAHTVDGSEIRRSPHHLIGISIYFFTAFSEPPTVCHQHFSNFGNTKIQYVDRIMRQIEVSERQKAKMLGSPSYSPPSTYQSWIGMDVMPHVSPLLFGFDGTPKSPNICD